MKRILYLLLAATLTLGCEKTTEPPFPLQGEWENTSLPMYMEISSDGSFCLYQNLKGTGYETYHGQFEMKGNILTGIYNDKEDLSYSYKVTVDGDMLTLEAVEDESVQSVFRNCIIPEYIRNNSIVTVKSGGLAL